MTKQKPVRKTASSKITGDVKGDVISGMIDNNTGSAAVGKNINQFTTSGPQESLEQARDAWLRDFAALTQKISDSDAPEATKTTARSLAEDLKAEASAPQPDRDQMNAIRKWFEKHLPALAGTVVSLVVNPIVGKLVEAGGEALVGQLFKKDEKK